MQHNPNVARPNLRGATHFAAGVEGILAEKSRSRRWLAGQVGISQATMIYRLKKSPGSFTVKDQFAIADALETDLEDIIGRGSLALEGAAA